MLGLNVPAIPVEHQYIVYDESPELKAYRQGGGRELAVLRESDKSYYLREERMGWILGPYEKGAPARFADGVPDWFGRSLFPGDLDRLLPHVEAAQRRVPSLENCGIKDIVNGPISYTPDGSPLIGPAWDLPNVWLNEGHSFGITAAGGSGWQLAEWIVEGEPGIDMLAVDPRRYGAYTSKRYVVKKNEETYRNVFVIHFPDEERPDGRPAKTSPVYDKIDRLGAVWGQRYGWERANWFAPPGVERKDRWSFRRSNYFEHVGNEVPPHARAGRSDRPHPLHQTRSLRTRRRGAGSTAWSPTRSPPGLAAWRSCHALTRQGGIRSEFTITKTGDEQFYVVSAGAAERYDGDYLRARLPQDGSVDMRNITTSRGCFVVAWPEVTRRAREVHRYAARQRSVSVADQPDARGRTGGRRPRACVSTSSAPSDGSCTSPSNTRMACSMRCSKSEKTHGIGMVGMRAMESCAWRSPTACGVAT